MPDTTERLAALAEADATLILGVQGRMPPTAEQIVAQQDRPIDMADPAVKAMYLLGYDRRWKRTSTLELLAEGEYQLRALEHARTLPDADGLIAYHLGELAAIREEAQRRLVNARRGYEAPSGLTAERIEAIKAAVPCQEYAEHLGRCHLKPKGRDRWEGLCPFHAERTPSFSVWVDGAHCFGCGWSGDVFALCMALLNLTFREACRVLADYAGLPDPLDPPPPLPRVVG